MGALRFSSCMTLYSNLKTINYPTETSSSERHLVQCTWWTSSYSTTSWINLSHGVRVRIYTPKMTRSLIQSLFHLTCSLSSLLKIVITWSKSLIHRAPCARSWTSVVSSLELNKRINFLTNLTKTIVSVMSSMKSVGTHFCP